MSEIGKGLRRGAKALLDFSTQQRLLEREKSQKLAEKQDSDTRAAMLKLTALNTPAGVAATKGILGDTFDPAQELEYRRLQGLLKPSLDAEQYGILNPLAAKIGLQGKFEPTALSQQKVETERERANVLKQRQRDDEAMNRLRRSKIASDIKTNDAELAETVSKLYEDASTGKARPDKLLGSLKTIETIAKGYGDHLKSIQDMPDFFQVNPKYADEAEGADDEELVELRKRPDFYVSNPKYAEQISNLEKSQATALAQKNRLLNAMLAATGDAQKLDAASGGQLAGNAGDNVKRQMAMELIRRNYPELYNKLQQAEFQRGLQFVKPQPQANGRQFEFIRPPQSNSPVIQTPDGLQWKFENGKYIQIR